MSAETAATLGAPRGSSYALQQLARAFTANATSWIGLVTFLVVVALALLAPLISPYDPLDQDILARLQGPSTAHWFGTDSYGRDILSRLLGAPACRSSSARSPSSPRW